jgi:succinyl-CoA synthetase beta subunit
MNIHEYQAKALFEKFGVPVPKGAAATIRTRSSSPPCLLPEGPTMVKSQIHAGGRGKGTFTDGFKGGVKFCKTKADAKDLAGKMLGNTLVTVQTGPPAARSRRSTSPSRASIKKEYYLAILLDRVTSQPVIVASTEGGVEIEKVAHETPEKITKVLIDPAYGLADFQVRELIFKLGLTGTEAKNAGKLIRNLYNCFWDTDAAMVEVNPLITTPDRRGPRPRRQGLLRRQRPLPPPRDRRPARPQRGGPQGDRGLQARAQLHRPRRQHRLPRQRRRPRDEHDGHHQALRRHPANFLDVGGGASKEQVVAAFKIILGDPNVKGILVNIFGGIMDCNVIAQGIVEAVKEVGLKLPLVVRLEGNNVTAGKATLAASGLKLTSGDTMADAAQKIVKLVA